MGRGSELPGQLQHVFPWGLGRGAAPSRKGWGTRAEPDPVVGFRRLVARALPREQGWWVAGRPPGELGMVKVKSAAAPREGGPPPAPGRQVSKGLAG